MTGVEKEKCPGLSANAMRIICKSKSYYFSSFAKRNAAYRLLCRVWKGASFVSQDGDVQDEDKDEIPGESEQVDKAENDYNGIKLPSTVSADNQQEMLPVPVEKYFTSCVSDEAVFSLLRPLQNEGRKRKSPCQN